MILFQRMLPEVCNFGIVLFISLLVQRNEPKKGHLPRGILASLNRSKNAAVNFIYLNLGIFLTILARKDVSWLCHDYGFIIAFNHVFITISLFTISLIIQHSPLITIQTLSFELCPCPLVSCLLSPGSWFLVPGSHFSLFHYFTNHSFTHSSLNTHNS